MKKITLLLLGTALITGTAYAGSSIFGGGKHKQASNPYGVDSINIHVCGSLECPPVRIVEGSCDGENMFQRWGVCVCEKGYVAIGTRCRTCPDGYISDGIHECQPCPTGTYRAHQSDTSCTDCPDIHATKCNSKGKTTECEDGYIVHEGECITCSLSPDECLSGALVDGECACAPVADNTPCTN